MNIDFPTKLQRAMMEIGTKNGLSAPKSQDPIDVVIHEFYVAETGRSLFDKRKKAALDKLKSFDTTGKIDKYVKDAEKGLTGTHSLYDGEHYTVTHMTKTPSETLDKVALRNELIKLGVDQVTIEKAFKSATKTNKPAETFSAMPKTT